MELKWKGKDIIKFLSLFETHSCLWDVNSDEFQDKRLRDDAYNDLLIESRMAGFEIQNIDSLKKKVKSLRDTFKKEIARVHKTQAMGVEVHKPRLMWFKEAKKLWDFPPPSCLGVKESKDSNKKFKLMELDLETQCVPESDQESACSSESEYLEISDAIRKSSSGSVKSSLKQLPTSSPPEKRMKIIHKSQGSETSAERSINTNNAIDDQYEHFAKHLASQLRQLPMKSFIILQNKLQNIITEERLANLSDS